jgi:hypothetical protein
MKSPARSRRHKTVEPIDFRELLDAPALNGLKEALAHRREPEAEIPHFPALPTIPEGENETPAVELTASESGAVESGAAESTAREFRAVELIAVETMPLMPQKFQPAAGIDTAIPPESTAVEPRTVELTALDSTAGSINAPDSGERNTDAVVSHAVKTDAPDLTAPISQPQICRDTQPISECNAPGLNAVNSTAVMPPAVEFIAVDSHALDLEDLDLGLLDESALGRRTGRRTFNVQPAARIETIFSPSELKVLNWMWSRGRAVDGVSMARLVTASNGEGMRRLAVHFGVAYTTFRNLVRSLSTKLAVAIVKQETTHPAIYLVYHYSAILERLRQAGLTGVIHKGGNAWVLVDADSQPAPPQPELTLQELKRKLIGLKTHAVQTTALPSSGREPKCN